MATNHEVSIPAKRYEDYDNCLVAAAEEYSRAHGLVGWDLSPRWADDQRDAIVLTVPDWADERCPVCGATMPAAQRDRRVAFNGAVVCGKATCEERASDLPSSRPAVEEE